MTRLFLLILMLTACKSNRPALFGVMTQRTREHLARSCPSSFYFSDDSDSDVPLISCDDLENQAGYMITLDSAGRIRALALSARSEDGLRADFERYFAPILPAPMPLLLRESIRGRLDEAGKRDVFLGLITKKTVLDREGVIDLFWVLDENVR